MRRYVFLGSCTEVIKVRKTDSKSVSEVHVNGTADRPELCIHSNDNLLRREGSHGGKRRIGNKVRLE